MTPKKLEKFNMKKVRITMHVFPHSIEKKTLIGILEAVPGVHVLWRNGGYNRYPHTDYYVHPDEGKSTMIEWNEIKLITDIQEVE